MNGMQKNIFSELNWQILRNYIEKAAWQFFPKRAFCDFEEKLQMNNSSMQSFLSQSILLGFAASIASIALLFNLNQQFVYITLFSVAAFCAPLLLNFFLQEYIFERNKRKKEEAVPDLLLHASVFPQGTGFAAILDQIAKADFGLLSLEFRKARQEIALGASVQKALRNLSRRNKSAVIDRAANLLLQGYESGADMHSIFHETAADLLETNAILQESNAALVVEKYTLMLGGGLIVPIVLGLIASLIAGFDFSGSELVDLGMAAAERRTILAATLLANKIYIAEYALIASFFIASQENNPKKVILYASLLLPLSLFAYFAANAFSF